MLESPPRASPNAPTARPMREEGGRRAERDEGRAGGYGFESLSCLTQCDGGTSLLWQHLPNMVGVSQSLTHRSDSDPYGDERGGCVGAQHAAAVERARGVGVVACRSRDSKDS